MWFDWQFGNSQDDCNNDNNTVVIKSGYMTKEGSCFKSWKRRFFVLRMNEHQKCASLLYYTSAAVTVPQSTRQVLAKGAIDMFHVSTIGLITSEEEGADEEVVPLPAAKQSSCFRFALVCSSIGRCLCLEVDSEEERRSWICELMRAKQVAKTKCNANDLQISNPGNATMNALNRFLYSIGLIASSGSPVTHGESQADHDSSSSSSSCNEKRNEQQLLSTRDHLLIDDHKIIPISDRGRVVHTLIQQIRALYNRGQECIESDPDASLQYLQQASILRDDLFFLIDTLGEYSKYAIDGNNLESFKEEYTSTIEALMKQVQDSIRTLKMRQMMADFWQAVTGSTHLIDTEPEYIVCSLEYAMEQLVDPNQEFNGEEEFEKFKKDFTIQCNHLLERAKQVLYTTFLDRVLDRVKADVAWADETTDIRESHMKLQSAKRTMQDIYLTRPDLDQNNNNNTTDILLGQDQTILYCLKEQIAVIEDRIKVAES